MKWFSPSRPNAEAKKAALGEIPEGGPRHVAIIMDGNGRWASKRHLPRLAGHKAGVDAVRRIVRAAPRLGIEALTLYAFSSENWRRSAEEVSDLMNLLRHHVLAELEELTRAGARLSIIGDWRALSSDVVERLERAMEATRGNDKFRLIIALNYGGQDELVRATRAIAQKVSRGELAADAIQASDIEAELDTADLPPLDLMIRTSGEQRLSNFLLWQAAYAEMWFTPVYWPEFNEELLREAVLSYAGRERRFGGR